MRGRECVRARARERVRERETDRQTETKIYYLSTLSKEELAYFFFAFSHSEFGHYLVFIL